MVSNKIIIVLIALLAFQPVAESGLLTAIGAYGLCQTACNAFAVTCYAAAGFTFGAVTAGVGVPAALVACNTGLGLCMAKCVAVAAGAAVVPTP